ncbi:MAG: DUF2162 family putative transporter [Desulfurispora sp.]|uniref:DUF2162 family putative transporter n=1 Tax=Desulfurispora sp. TaxID=3014275 RepID=UPI00404B334B
MLLALLALLPATLLLALKSGLLLGTVPLGRRQRWPMAGSLALILLLAALSAEQCHQQLAALVDKYTFHIATLSGVLLLYLAAASRTPAGRQIWPALLPCPLCVLALAVSSTLLSTRLQVSAPGLATGTALFYLLVTLSSSWLSQKLLQKWQIDLESALQFLLLALGSFTLFCVFAIPNLVAAMHMPFQPLEIAPPDQLVAVAGASLIILLLGYLGEKHRWKSRKHSTVPNEVNP